MGRNTTTPTSNQPADRAELERLKAENAELRRQISEFKRAEEDRAKYNESRA